MEVAYLQGWSGTYEGGVTCDKVSGACDAGSGTCGGSCAVGPVVGVEPVVEVEWDLGGGWIGKCGGVEGMGR